MPHPVPVVVLGPTPVNGKVQVECGLSAHASMHACACTHTRNIGPLQSTMLRQVLDAHDTSDALRPPLVSPAGREGDGDVAAAQIFMSFRSPGRGAAAQSPMAAADHLARLTAGRPMLGLVRMAAADRWLRRCALAFVGQASQQ